MIFRYLIHDSVIASARNSGTDVHLYKACSLLKIIDHVELQDITATTLLFAALTSQHNLVLPWNIGQL